MIVNGICNEPIGFKSDSIYKKKIIKNINHILIKFQKIIAHELIKENICHELYKIDLVKL